MFYGPSLNFNPFAGDGTQANPYQIQTIFDLKLLRENITNYDKHFILANNLTFTSTYYTNSTLGWEPIGSELQSFTGTFDGNSKTIHNLFINRPNSDEIGLFGAVTGNIIRISQKMLL